MMLSAHIAIQATQRQRQRRKRISELATNPELRKLLIEEKIIE